MSSSLKHIIPAAAAALLALTALPGCFTGIERTPVIKDKGSEKVDPTVAQEQALLAPASAQPPAQWASGKAFIVCEGKIELAFAPASLARELTPGDILRFERIESASRLSGDSITNFIFLTPDGRELTHRIDGARSLLLESKSLPIPFTIQADQVDQARRILKGLKLWTRRTGKNGRRYEKVAIVDVVPGSPDYPLTVVLDNGEAVSMVIDSPSATARTFANLFSLTDPRERYPQISDAHWELICRGKIAAGMSREECRLALGGPANVEREAAYNGIIERWTYENGVYLYFTDGLLTSFRQ